MYVVEIQWGSRLLYCADCGLVTDAKKAKRYPSRHEAALTVAFLLNLPDEATVVIYAACEPVGETLEDFMGREG